MLSIRPATLEDVPLLRTLVQELAAFERLSEYAVITENDLRRDGFGPQPKFRSLIAEWDGKPAGYACFFGFYSTFAGKPGLFLEDLFVRDAFRGKGIGKALLAHIAKIARQENCVGLRWEVLDWNSAAIDFYRKVGGTFREDWKTVMLEEEAFERLAGEAR
jgi:GNAT superfamily N-acetyltransferase